MKEKAIKIVMFIIVLSFTQSMFYAKSKYSDKLSKIFVSLESHSEDMLDAIDIKDTKQLNKLYEQLKNEMKALNQINMKQHAFNMLNEFQTKALALENSWFSLISLEMKEKDDLPALANAINQFSGELIILTNFKKNYKKDVAWMDYLGREIMLLNKNYPNSTQELVTIRKIDLQKTWGRISMSLQKDKKNSALIPKTDLLISDIVKSKNAAELVSLAKKELEIVDDIEKAFNI